MIAVIGLSRFPVYLDNTGEKNLGANPPTISMNFKNYVNQLPKNEISIVLYQVNYGRFRRRILLGSQAVNPHLKFDILPEILPKKIFVYPDNTPDIVKTDRISIGVRIPTRKPLYLPVADLRLLTKKEAMVLRAITKIKELTLEKIELFLPDMDISITAKQQFPNGNTALRITDSKIQETYAVLVNPEGKINSTNVCVDPRETLYLIEMILLLREQKSLHIFNDQGYDWIQF
ncbi:MAG: hypothetical protein ACFFBD_26025 [Candidatus Hodarchaeota archaeon]